MKKFWQWLLVKAVKHLDKDADGVISIVINTKTKNITIK